MKKRLIAVMAGIAALFLGCSGISADTVSGNEMSLSVAGLSEAEPLLNYHEIDKETPESSDTESFGKFSRQLAGAYPSAYRSDRVDTDGDGTPDTSYLPDTFRQQGSYGTCWAFSALGACEASLIKKGVSDNSIALSVNHLNYFFYHKPATMGDLLGNTIGDYNRATSTKEIYNLGGNNYFTMWHLANWIGPVSEKRDAQYRYSALNKNFTLPETKEEMYGKTDYHLQNCYVVDMKDKESVKKQIMQLGAIGVSYYGTTSSQSERLKYDSMAAGKTTGDEGSYYVNIRKDTNHAVLLIGWDDDYPASNFVSKPDGNGAWLLRNSWGEEDKKLAQDGYFWISYYDQSLADTAFAYDCEAGDNYEHIYQHDGASGAESAAVQTAANVFKACAAGDRDESIQAVSIGIDDAKVAYRMDLYVYGGATTVGKDTMQSGTIAATKTGILPYAGYHTIRLDTPVTVSAGQSYAVVFSFPNGKANVHYDADANYSWVVYYTDTQSGQSLYKETAAGAWQDCGAESWKGNFRIKAFTDSLETSLTGITLDRASMVLTGDGKDTIRAEVTGSTSNKGVTWFSDNEKIASVQNGVVTGIGKGTTRIWAYTVNGKKAFCNVTVTLQSLNSPSLLTAKSADYNKVVLQWAQGNVNGYEICRATSAGGDYEVVGTAAGGTVTTYTDKRLTCGKTYYYKIRQYRTINGRKVYGELSDYVKAKPVPKAVKIKKLKASKGKITITWKKQAKAYGYEIYRSTKASAKGSKIARVKGTVKYIDTKKIKKRKTYYYRVRAYQLVKGKKVYGAYSEAKKINGR